MIICGDALEELRKLSGDSISAIVTDPPYGFSFMGKKWDYDVPSVEIWKECLRVLKPGGHLLSFGGPRTYHRLACAIEDAGFEIRDQIQWIFGSGFPKSLDISKAIDKAAGAEREVVGLGRKHGKSALGVMNDDSWQPSAEPLPITAPATDAAKQWQGFGTALKPANEPICLARKPLSEKTVAANVLRWSTGALNIDASRIGTAADMNPNDFDDSKRKSPKFSGILNGGKEGEYRSRTGSVPNGRFPSNLLLDETAAQMLDEQSGLLKTNPGTYRREERKGNGNTFRLEGNGVTSLGDSGGASRFFYCAKTSRAERNAGCQEVITWESADQNLAEMAELSQLVKDISEDTMRCLADTSWSTDLYGHSISEQYPTGFRFTIETVIKLITELKTSNSSIRSLIKENILDAIRMIEASGLSLAESVAFLSQLDRTTTRESTASVLGASHAVLQTLLKIRGVGKQGNVHSTVKPLKLMRYLCRLVTPPGGLVLDPFMGSGSTGLAALEEGFKFIGIEREAEYCEIAEKRIFSKFPEFTKEYHV